MLMTLRSVDGPGIERSAEEQRAFAHSDQSAPRTVELYRSTACVQDLDLQGVTDLLDSQLGCRSGPRMFQHIRQRLLNDPVGEEVDSTRDLGLHGHDERGLDASRA